MKLKDLNPQPGQVYQRLDLPEWCIIMPNGDAKLVLDGSTCSCFYRAEEVEGDWSLLQPPLPALPPELSLEERITAALTKRNVCCNGDIKSLVDDLAALLGGSHE